MESHDWDNGMEDEERPVYGAHQDYDDDGNYHNSHYAMGASMDHPKDAIDSDEDDDVETYAS